MKRFTLPSTAAVVFLFAATSVLPAVTAFAYSYSYSSGADNAVFGSPTSTDNFTDIDTLTQNIRRNKDVAYSLPPYGVFGGYIPTEPLSPYYDGFGIDAPPFYSNGNSITPLSFSDGSSITPLFFSDGTIGSLSFPSLNKTLPVFEGETPENMQKGIGHFTDTSAWEGNAAFAGHNGGKSPYFDFVERLAVGEEIIYTTPYGVRTYTVREKTKIADTDFSALNWSGNNILTLVTCVSGEPGLRWQVTALEVNNRL